MVFVTHWHESAMGTYESSHPESPAHLLPHSIPLSCPRVLALGALFQASNLYWSSIFSLDQSHSHVWLFVISCTEVHQAFLSITNSWSLLKLMSIELVMPSNHLILSRSLLPLPSVFHSIRVSSNESVLCIRWPNYSSFSSVSVIPTNIQDWFSLELARLISLKSKGLSRVFSNTTVQKHQFFSTQFSL